MKKIICFLIIGIVSTNLAAKASKEAERYYRKAVKLHNSADIAQVFYWYAKAGELGHPVAQYNLAVMYADAQSVYKDYQQSVYWYKKSADQGFALAQFRLGEMYYFAKGGLKQNIAKALALFNMAAEQGELDAQTNLGVIYASHGNDYDQSLAIDWLNKASRAGSEEAAYFLGVLLEADDRMISVERQSIYWLKKRANLGFVLAQYKLANHYMSAKSLAKDPEQAVFWYKKAAAQGNVDAQFELGLMYARGEYILQNLFEAKRWIELAWKNGSQDAETVWKQYRLSDY